MSTDKRMIGMQMLPPDVQQYVFVRFKPSDQPAVIEALERAVLHDESPAEPRFLRCALFASHGDLASLRYWVDELAIDFRDVVIAGEYVRKHGDWVQVRDMNQPFPADD